LNIKKEKTASTSNFLWRQSMTLYISPTRRLTNLREAMDRMMEDTIAEISPREREMTLAVDIKSKEDGYVVRAFVPGLSSDDLQIEILNNSLAIRGEFKAEQEENGKFLTYELPTGRFSRVITLPTALDAAKAEATIKDGVLTLWVPKTEAHRPRSIQVKTA
jgi:HSP20 family protein